jgi:hypothetical protein
MPNIEVSGALGSRVRHQRIGLDLDFGLCQNTRQLNGASRKGKEGQNTLKFGSSFNFELAYVKGSGDHGQPAYNRRFFLVG